MIIFKKISWQNFLSTGDKPIEIDLCKDRSVLIVGANGSGKSTLLDALSYALFGKPHRAISKLQLVNSINQKNCSVTVDFSIGKLNFKVIRGARPAIFEIWQDGALINQESHSRDYQKVLEINILKLNHKSFHQIVVLGASTFIPFMQLPQWHRREVIEDLLDISVFTQMNVILKEKTAKMKDALVLSESAFVLIKEKIALQAKHIDDLRHIDQDKFDVIRKEITILQEEIAEKYAAQSRLTIEISAKEETTTELLRSVQAKRQSLKTYQFQIQSNLIKSIQLAEFYSKNDSCPTCFQPIDLAFKADKHNLCSTRSTEIQAGLDKLNRLMAESDSQLQEVEIAMTSVRETQNQVSILNGSIASIGTQLSNLNKKLLAPEASIDLSSAETVLSALRTSRDELTELRASQSTLRTYNIVLGEMLKDTGIKTKVIRQYLPVINKFANHYLGVLDFFVSFTLDEAFDEKVRSRHRDDFSYASFSEGEKQRIDLALLFTWRQIAKMKNSASTNLLILDETFDSSMDADGVDNLLKIINMMDVGTNTFVISHKQDLLENRFPAKLEFKKVNNFSTISA